MEDCLHTSSENLSKLVSWAHSHGTICSLIPNLKHLLSEGAHGNLTAMWGCSAGHAYHWPLAATCRAGSQERVCFQDSRSFNSDSPSMLGVPSEAQASPLQRYPGQPGKAKLDCTRTRDSCDFSYCSEPSELGEPVEEYEDEATLFDMVCESSVTDEDSDFEPHTHRALTQMSKPKPQAQAGPSCLGTTRALPQPAAGPDPEPQRLSSSPPGLPRLATQRLPRGAPACPARGESVPPAPPLALGGEAASSPAVSAEPEVSSSQQQPHAVPTTNPEAAAQSMPDQDERAAELSREQNEKTIRSTQTALRNFREFLISKYPSETREIYVIPCKELDAYLASFFVDARQKDGSEYEPNSLANYQCGLERYLKEHRYGYSITRDKEFKRSQEALKQKQIELRCKGKGNKPHKSMKLTFADELILRKRGLLSRYNPVWLNNTKAFGHCTGFHGSTLKWGDIRLRVTETGLEYLEWMGPDNGDVNAKSKRGGTDSRVYATQHSPQTCPVQDYKEYAQRRPPAMRYEDAPFYLSIKPVVNLAALHWYNCQALGKNKLAKMVKTMCEKGNIPGRKTNFSVYQSCSTLSEAQSNQLVLICNNLSQQAAQSMASHSNTGNFIVSASYDSSSDTA
ncbi:KIAA1958 ortholog [Columba livia]|uniref:KIAA1958 ortholog n=1 Tax=Columba livia TaxID=8932 RepID=A0A2I0M5C9_COLLI|nr:KIAA1958 ortholog [Columba livia]